MGMTEQMVIGELKALRKDDKRVYAEEYEALEVAIQALEEIQQYRAIGTVQQCKEVVEKSQEMKLKPPIAGTFEYKGICPVCENQILISEKYCSQCGQKVGR